MRAFRVSEHILPLGEFKTNAAGILKDLASRENPLIITQNGHPACVVLSPAEYDRLREREAFLIAVARGMADADVGRTMADDELGDLLDAEFGPLETR